MPNFQVVFDHRPSNAYKLPAILLQMFLPLIHNHRPERNDKDEIKDIKEFEITDV